MGTHSTRFGFVVIAIVALCVPTTLSAAASPRWSDWSAPVWLGATINSSFEEAGPAISKDGLALYFNSTRPGGIGGEDIYVSYRASLNAAWGTPQNLGAPINTTANERVPAFSRDGHWMFFARGSGPFDLWVSYRLHVHEDTGEFGWQAPISLTELNTPFGEAGPNYFQDEKTGMVFLFFNSNRPGGGGSDIYVAVQQPDGSFGAVSNVTPLNSPYFDARSTISHDGLEIIFNSNRGSLDPLGPEDLWSATRESTTANWSTPVTLTTLNSTAEDFTPYLSADSQTLFFASNRSGGLGGGDIWMSTRTKGKP